MGTKAMLQEFWQKMAAVLAVALLLSGCFEPEFFEPEFPNYRYRLTVEVETPEGLKTGSSVIEVETDRAGPNAIPNPGYVRFRVRGEAVAVDMPNGQTLYALLRSNSDVDWAKNIVFIMAPDPPRGVEDRFRARFDLMLAMQGEITLPRTLGAQNPNLHSMSGYPMLVTFGDIADPTTVTRVDPDDLAASFGDGVSLKRITVELTDDPVTTGIEERLGWLPDYYDRQLSGDRFQMLKNKEKGLSAFISAGAFSAGVGLRDKGN